VIRHPCRLLLALALTPVALPAAAGGAPTLRAIVGAPGAASSIADQPVAGFVITSPQGVKVFVDVAVVPAELLPELENPRNVFLVTHPHADHMDRRALAAFKGKTLLGGSLVRKKGSFGVVTSGDVRVEAIASSHMDDELDGTTNSIMVIDVAGTRIVHFGDCGQTKLAPRQKKLIGKVDVAIHAFEDISMEADVANQKAFKFLATVAPTVVIPTHIITPEAIKLLAAAYPAEIAATDELEVTPALLAAGKRAVFMGGNRARAEKAGIPKHAAPAGPAPLLRQVRFTGVRTPTYQPDRNGFVITSPQGVKVIVDVANLTPDIAAELENPRNVFLATHTHPDHMSPGAYKKARGPKLVCDHLDPGTERGPFPTIAAVSSGDVKVEAIASSHLDDELDPRSNLILVIDVAGVRIVHFGDCGQDALTAEQLKRIGRVDVMIHILEDNYSEADVVNRKAFKVLAQVGPRLVIPTHASTVDAMKLLDQAYPAEIAAHEEIALTPALLAGGKRAVIMGENREVAARAGIRKSDAL